MKPAGMMNNPFPFHHIMGIACVAVDSLRFAGCSRVGIADCGLRIAGVCVVCGGQTPQGTDSWFRTQTFPLA